MRTTRQTISLLFKKVMSSYEYLDIHVWIKIISTKYLPTMKKKSH